MTLAAESAATMRPPRGGGGGAPIWTTDGRSIIETYAKEGKANLGVFDVATGKETDVTSGNQAVGNFRSRRAVRSWFLRFRRPHTSAISSGLIGRVAAPKQLTHSNDELFSHLNLTEPEEIWYTSFDGKRIQAWMQKPPDFDPAKKYPLILNIHGGPHAAYGFVFDHEFQWMAAKGYVVLYPNPRGSTSYGQEFGNIIQYHYPGDDYKDLMAGVDEVLKRGYVDSDEARRDRRQRRRLADQLDRRPDDPFCRRRVAARHRELERTCGTRRISRSVPADAGSRRRRLRIRRTTKRARRLPTSTT